MSSFWLVEFILLVFIDLISNSVWLFHGRLLWMWIQCLDQGTHCLRSVWTITLVNCSEQSLWYFTSNLDSTQDLDSLIRPRSFDCNRESRCQCIMSHSLIRGPTYLLWCRPHARQAAAAADRGLTAPSPQGRPPLRASEHPPQARALARAAPSGRRHCPRTPARTRITATDGAPTGVALTVRVSNQPASLSPSTSTSPSLPLHLFLWHQIRMFLLGFSPT